MFATFVAIIPYTLVWLYYAKDALINLSLPLIVMSGLWASNNATNTKSKLWYGLAIFLLVFAFSSYVAVINMIGVCVLGSMVMDYVYGKQNFIDIVRNKIPYHLCEDTVMTYQMMKKANSSKVLAAPYNIICPVFKIFNKVTAFY